MFYCLFVYVIEPCSKQLDIRARLHSVFFLFSQLVKSYSLPKRSKSDCTLATVAGGNGSFDGFKVISPRRYVMIIETPGMSPRSTNFMIGFFNCARVF